jgi:adenine-specific DNA-methyltransferase
MNEQLEKLTLTSMNIVDDRIESLRKIFPEVFKEGHIDFDSLQRSLGNWVDPGKERFGLTWPGKAECIKIIQQPSVGTLLPMRDESINFDTTENLIIEGENLEVLKLLQKSYYGKIKMIYIDPPYNTGNEFIYPDRFHEGLQDYLKYSGQVNAEGFKVSTNIETDGRYHSNWLNMMYPRLFLARNLLRDDGVIFVSIDDHEVHNLRALMNEIFGEENFVSTFVWRRRASSALAEKLVSNDHEYLMAYQKLSFTSLGIPKEFAGYANPDNDLRGDWTTGDLTVGMTKEQRPNQFYPLIDPDTGNIFQPNPNRVWAYISESMDKLIDEKRVIFPHDATKRPMLKRFKNELRSDANPISTWLDKVGLNSEGTRELQDLLGENVSIYPKPSSLLKDVFSSCIENNDIVIDFFAGSGTTAQAILELNEKDNGNRKFILIQLPEKTNKPQFPTIADITRERVRRIIKKIKNHKNIDLGFKAYKLSSSNFKVWQNNFENIESLSKTLPLFIEHLDQSRNTEDILYELLLKTGYPLTASIEKLSLANKEVFFISEGALLICLDHNLTLEAIESMVERSPVMIICLDEGFKGNDQLKVNAVQTIKSHNQNTESSIMFRVV